MVPGTNITFSGKYFSGLHPDPEKIELIDIAHSLSNLCRWGGHCPVFYPVAEHSIHLYKRVPKKLKKAALLHDAGEAFLGGDLPTPLKDQFPAYQKAENNLLSTIFKKYGVDIKLLEELHYFDIEIRNAERIYFFGNLLKDYNERIRNFEKNIFRDIDFGEMKHVKYIFYSLLKENFR